MAAQFVDDLSMLNVYAASIAGHRVGAGLASVHQYVYAWGGTSPNNTVLRVHGEGSFDIPSHHSFPHAPLKAVEGKHRIGPPSCPNARRTVLTGGHH